MTKRSSIKVNLVFWDAHFVLCHSFVTLICPRLDTFDKSSSGLLPACGAG